ncbi:hypothetical protein QBC47DRAFT_438860, partial [Echria macrotheca]
MASEVQDDGRVITLNITKPAPSLNLHGFQWRGAEGLAIEEVQQPAIGVEVDHESKPAEQHISKRVVESIRQVPLQGLVAPAKDDVSPSFPLDVFEGSWAGNGFNLIFVPISGKKLTELGGAAGAAGLPRGSGPPDNILILNLTTEQWTFGPNLGKVPNRGMGKQDTINLDALSYIQTVQDVTNVLTGKGDRVETNKTGIHFEPGVWLRVPQAEFHKDTVGRESIVRMASIPHGTTINAQGLVPGPESKIKGRPDFVKAAVDTTPFPIGDPAGRIQRMFTSMNADTPNVLRVPQDLSRFNNKELPANFGKGFGTGRITTDIIKNPNLVLAKANEGLKILETITFELSTGVGRKQGPTTAKLNGGGTTNISFLQGERVRSMTNTWWIEKVEYDVVVPPLLEGETATLWAKMPTPSTAPTPKFAVTAPKGGVKQETPIKVQGVQLQYSQTVNLNFGPAMGNTLTWPHVSVATLVPVTPQPFQM